MFAVLRIQQNVTFFLVFLTGAALFFFTISISEMKLAFQIRQVNINSLLILSVFRFSGKRKRGNDTKNYNTLEVLRKIENISTQKMRTPQVKN
jgi:hypothetical protein